MIQLKKIHRIFCCGLPVAFKVWKQIITVLPVKNVFKGRNLSLKVRLKFKSQKLHDALN